MGDEYSFLNPLSDGEEQDDDYYDNQEEYERHYRNLCHKFFSNTFEEENYTSEWNYVNANANVNVPIGKYTRARRYGKANGNINVTRKTVIKKAGKENKQRKAIVNANQTKSKKTGDKQVSKSLSTRVISNIKTKKGRRYDKYKTIHTVSEKTTHITKRIKYQPKISQDEMIKYNNFMKETIWCEYCNIQVQKCDVCIYNDKVLCKSCGDKKNK